MISANAVVQSNRVLQRGPIGIKGEETNKLHYKNAHRGDCLGESAVWIQANPCTAAVRAGRSTISAYTAFIVKKG